MSAAQEALDPDGWVSKITAAEFDAKLEAKARRRRERGELTRLATYMNRGGRLVRDDVPGVGVVYRAALVCTVAPFSPASVEKWCEREGKPLPPDTAGTDASQAAAPMSRVEGRARR